MTKVFELSQNWQATVDALGLLSSREARYALAVATSQTGRVIAQGFSEQFGSREASRRIGRFARVTTMATPNQSQLHAKVEVPKAKVFTPASRHRLPPGMRRSAYIALMNHDTPTHDPERLLDAGAFIVRTRAGQSFKASSATRRGKTLGLIAQRRGLKRLPIDKLGRIYPMPQFDLADIAEQVAPKVFELALQSSLNVAYRRSALPLLSTSPSPRLLR